MEENYPEWKEKINSLNLYSRYSTDPTYVFATAYEDTKAKVNYIEKAAVTAGGDLAGYILRFASYGMPLRMIPAELSYFMSCYRKFFAILDKGDL